MLDITQDHIKNAYDAMIEALICFEDASHELDRAKVAWQIAFEDALVSGQLDGRNEATRNAQARALFPELWQELQEAEEDLAVCRKDYRVCELETKTLSKCMELAKLSLATAVGVIS